jgi:threonine dehydratase
MTICIERIRAAAAMLRGQIFESPLAHSASLSELAGADVYLKLENLQRTASFKERGALVKLLSLDPDARRRGVIALSAGNHGQGVAFHARRLGIAATIVMPSFTPDVKVERTRSFGAEVILHGETLEAAARFTEAQVHERGLALVHPYDDADVIAGQGTVALEMLAAEPALDVLLVPAGGGGLLAGCAVAAKALRREIQVIGVQAARFPALRCALDGRAATCGESTLAEGIAVSHPGQIPLAIARTHVDDVLLADEEEIENAVLVLLEVEKTVAEGAGAVGLAALLATPARFAGRRVGIVISGGNIDLLPLSSILQRGLVRSGRLLRIRVTLPDRPGALARAADCLGDAGANIVQVEHQRTFTGLPLQVVEARFVLQTRGPAHARQVLEQLRHAGFPTQLVDEPV